MAKTKVGPGENSLPGGANADISQADVDRAMGLLSNPLVQSLVMAIINGIAKLFGKGPGHGVKPVTSVFQGGLPAASKMPDDDHIVAKGAAADLVGPPVRGRLILERVQLNRQRFPEAYTDANPFGLVQGEEKQKIEDGTGAMCFGSKFWCDLTLFDKDGRELTPDAVIAQGLNFKTRWECESLKGDSTGLTFIAGKGGQSNPRDPAPYEAGEGGFVGQGGTAWASSMGFLHQYKAFGEGEIEVRVSVIGQLVPINSLRMRVS